MSVLAQLGIVVIYIMCMLGLFVPQKLSGELNYFSDVKNISDKKTLFELGGDGREELDENIIGLMRLV